MPTLPTDAELKAAVGSGLRTAAGLLVLAAVLASAVLAFGEHGAEVQGLWHRMDVVHLLGGWLVTTTGMVCLALRWRALFPPGVEAGPAPLTGILLVGTLLNFALPGPVGEFVGAALAGRRFGFAAEAALAAGIAARFVGLAVAGVVSLLLLQFGGLPLPAELAPWIRMATLLLAGAALILATLAAFPDRLRAVANGTTGRFARLASLHASLVRFADALGALGRRGALPFLRAAGWALAGHGCVITGIWIAGHGLGAPPGWPGLIFTYAASTVGAIALFALPGAQMGWDALFASLLGVTANVSVAAALAITVFVRAQQLSIVCLGAVVLLRWLRDGTGRLVG